MLNPLDPDELGRVWSTFSQPFRLSVMYEVPLSSWMVRTTNEQTRPNDWCADVRAPFRPPVVEQLTPLSGPIGTQITVSGQHLGMARFC